MTIDDLREELIKELGSMRGEFVEGYAAISQRLDKMDLNGTAKHLKRFGEFLEAHPQFMERQIALETEIEDREVAIAYLKRKFHLNNLKMKSSLLIGGVGTGFLLAIGNALFQPFNGLGHEIQTVLQHVAHAMK